MEAADSLDGPWKNQGTIAIDGNGFSTDGTQSNVSMTVRPDGGILMVSRHGIIMLSTSGIMGPYKVQGPSVYPDIPDRNFGNAEDPVIWYSGGKYHILYNYWDAKVAYQQDRRRAVRRRGPRRRRRRDPLNGG